MNPFLRYLADKNSAHTHTHTQTDRQTHADDHKTLRGWECGPKNVKNFHFLVKSRHLGATSITDF